MKHPPLNCPPLKCPSLECPPLKCHLLKCPPLNYPPLKYQYHKLSVKCNHLVAACLKVRIVGTPATDFCTYIEQKGSNFWYELSWTIPNNCITIPTFMLRYPNPPNFKGTK